MKPLARSNVLGLAVGERRVMLAEVGGARPQVKRTAEFAWPAELSWDKPVELGAALRAFLKQQGFGTSRAVVGVPARWLMAREKEIPPASAELAAGALRLQAERDFGTDASALATDYAGKPDPQRPRRVLLVAMLQSQLQKILQMLGAAGLTPLAVSSSSLVLAAQVGRGGEEEWLLSVSAETAELAGRADGAAPVLRHLPIPLLQHAGNGSMTGALGGELRRAVALSPGGVGGAARAVTLWDGLGLADTADLSRRAGLELQPAVARPEWGEPRFGPAVALAMSGVGTVALPIDLLHSRLALPRRQWFQARVARIAAAVIVLAAAVGALAWDMHRQQAELALLSTRLAGMKTDIQTAEVFAEKMSLARGWHDQRPEYLGCLREITRAFPDQGTIWASSFTLRDSREAAGPRSPTTRKTDDAPVLKGLLIGRATDQTTVLAVRDKLAANPRLAEVRLLEMRDAGGNSREIAFSLSFTFGAMP